mgnify:CR=1 FL=1
MKSIVFLVQSLDASKRFFFFSSSSPIVLNLALAEATLKVTLGHKDNAAH